MQSNLRPASPFLLPVAILAALTLRGAILAAGSVPFNSDEAVVALMARHTLLGKWPLFFYGQSYMGSLDATLIATAFLMLGQSVWVVRLVQTALFVGTVATTYAIGQRFYRDRWTAVAAALLVALPSVLVSTYTTATLGGYGEVLLLGNLILLLAHAVAAGRRGEGWAWLALGTVGGLAFWTSALSTVYLLPAGALLLVRLCMAPGAGQSRRPFGGLALAAAGFLVGSGPWWWYNLGHDWAALRFVLTGQEVSGIGVQQVTPPARLAGMLLLGLPALIGMRLPWSAEYLPLPLAIVPVMAVLGAPAWALVQAWRKREPGQFLLLGVGATFAALFLVSRFGTDATGRYFLPLLVPMALWTADLLARVRAEKTWLAAAGLAYLLAFNLLGNALAIQQNPPGFTTQFDPSNRFDNAHDAELITFLRSIGVTRGYSNFFVAFRIAFLSQETVVLSPQLPYKPDLSYNPADDRYPPYTREVERASEVVYVTSINPTLDSLLAERMVAAGVSFAERQIGPYHVFYRLGRHVAPRELGFGAP